MKTVFINCSPKKRFCASSYFIMLERLFVSGTMVTEVLRTKSDHERILAQLKDADAVVFSLPLYVDGIPSHVMRFMEVLELYCRENDLHFGVYCIANNGFIEGRQNEPLMQIFENFCARSGLRWGGGTGIGGGVMLNVTRILFAVQVVLLLVNIVLSGVQTGNFLPKDYLLNFAENVLILLFFNLGVLWYLGGMGSAIRKKAFFGKKYTRILLPSFIFIIFADIFFIVVSVIEGGIFRGWLSKKQIENVNGDRK